MLKTILSLSRLEEFKAYRLLSTTSVDVSKLEEVKDLADALIDPANLARLVLITRFIKIFQQAIILFVNHPNKSKDSITKNVDESAYSKMIEDFTKNVLKSRETVFLMRLVPHLIHSGFITQKTKEAVIASFERLVNEHASRENNHALNRIEHVEEGPAANQEVMIDTTDRNKN